MTDCRMEPEAKTCNEKNMEWRDMVTIHAESAYSLLSSSVPIPVPTTHQHPTFSTWLQFNSQALPVNSEHDPWPLFVQVYGTEHGQVNTSQR